MADNKHKRSLLNVLITNVPGARSYVLLIFLQLLAFLFSVILSSYLFIESIQLGKYAETILSDNIYIIVFIWVVFWLILFSYSLKAALNISYYIAGPIKRMEKVLDDILNGMDTALTVRDADALSGIATRVNAVVEMYKNNKIEEQKKVFEEYKRKVDETERECDEKLKGMH